MPPGHHSRAVQQYRAKVLDRIVAACADGSLDPSELAARSEAAQQATTPSALPNGFSVKSSPCATAAITGADARV